MLRITVGILFGTALPALASSDHAPVKAPVAHADTPVNADAHAKSDTHAKPDPHAKVETPAKVKADAHAQASTPGFFAKIWEKAPKVFKDIHAKVEKLHQAEEENESLKQENAALRLALETRDFEARSRSAEEKTQGFANRLERETWAYVGRTAQGIQYEIPQALQPGQLYTLGVDYFRAGEDEKAAKIFTFLAGLEDGEFTGPDHLMLNGVVWYRLENYRISDAYFEKILELPTATDRQKAQTRIWRAVIAERKGDHRGSQKMLSELLARHPKAPEVAWVNPLVKAKTETKKEGERVPASHEKH